MQLSEQMIRARGWRSDAEDVQEKEIKEEVACKKLTKTHSSSVIT